MGTASAWTPERRATQAARIRRLKPWEKSTGPRTEKGKAQSSRNAFNYGFRPIERTIARHARVGAKIVKLEIRLTGIRSLSRKVEFKKDCSLRIATIQKGREELVILYQQLERARIEMMEKIATDVDW